LASGRQAERNGGGERANGISALGNMETKSMSDEVEITRRKLTTGGEEKFDLGAALDALQAKDLRKQDALAVLDLPKGCHAFDDKQIRGAKQVLIVQAQRIIAHTVSVASR
jgi:hypothetical protein